jgi:Skp family chaperone for outer membrane proteins
MKKIVVFLFFLSISASAQTAKGVKIGYIDMEYILEKVPDYADALNQLELKAQNWKQEIETKRNELTTLKENLKTERILLTKNY